MCLQGGATKAAATKAVTAVAAGAVAVAAGGKNMFRLFYLVY